MTEDTVRLAKQLAQQLPCSRAEATNYIEGGWVRVDGQIVEEPGARIMPEASIELLPGATAEPVQAVTLLLHKPAGMPSEAALQLITEQNRSADDRAPQRFLNRHRVGLSVLAPLERDASGLLVLTQDWRVQRKLTQDAERVEHEIIVEVSGTPAADGLAQVNGSIVFQGKATAPMKVSWQNERRLRFAVKAPPPGLIAHACAQLGLTPVAMKRIRLGRVAMAGLQAGQWRYLQAQEQF